MLDLTPFVRDPFRDVTPLNSWGNLRVPYFFIFSIFTGPFFVAFHVQGTTQSIRLINAMRLTSGRASLQSP